MNTNTSGVLRQLGYLLLRVLWTVSLGMIIAGSLIGGHEGIGIILGVLALTWLVFLFQSRLMQLPHASAAAQLAVLELSRRMGIATPEVYEVEDARTGAYAMSDVHGRGSVVVTSGLLRLPKDEIEGVIAHEMAHIKSRDSQLAMVMFTCVALVGANVAVGALGTWAMAAVVGLLPLVGWTRELRADVLGARASGNPIAIARVLQRSKSYNILTDLPLWLLATILTLLHSGSLPLLLLLLLAYAVARMLPDHPPTCLRTWLLRRGRFAWVLPGIAR